MLKISRANGVNGHLLPQIDGTLLFRVYAKDHTFKDYSLHHCDLCVTINDEDAFFYEGDEEAAILDHSPATLGINAKIST